MCGRTRCPCGSAGSSAAGRCERHDCVCLDASWLIVEVVEDRIGEGSVNLVAIDCFVIVARMMTSEV